jgi:hypothetical protein
MRKASRSTPTPGNHDLVPPTTPNHMGTPNSINEIIRSLNATYDLGLQVQGPHWSPSTRSKSTAGKLCGRIQHLNYKDPTTLADGLNKFGRIALELSREERLDQLMRLLPLRTGTPKSSLREATIQSPRTVLAQSFFPSQMRKYIIPDLRSYSI